VQRSEGFLRRIQSFSLGTTDRRLAEALLHFSERIGHETEVGSVEMIAFTHELLAQYISTTREQVTLLMNQFRHEGYVRYSRKGIVLRPEMLREWLRRSLPLAA
jgi:CRP-like cAMP-binding protein